MGSAVCKTFMHYIEISEQRIPCYPAYLPVTLDMRDEIQSILMQTEDGVSEYTFANLFLFRERYNYRVSITRDGVLIISGGQDGERFFMTPLKAPCRAILDELFSFHDYWKGIPDSLLSANRERFEFWGIEIAEDRDNFDYLYLRDDLARLQGKKYHKKKNHVNTFANTYTCEAKPLDTGNISDAIAVLDAWQEDKSGDTDYRASREALTFFDQLGLCGVVYYIDDKPVGWCLGESLAQERIFAVHFEKGINAYKGIYQFINQQFAAALPESVIYINREQDLGDEGLRQAKMTYRPCGFVKKYIGRRKNEKAGG